MKRPHWLGAAACAACVAAAPRPAAAMPWDPIEKLPGQSPVTVLVSDKPRVYFRVTPQAPLVVPLQGPLRLKVISRAEIPAGAAPLVTYRLRALSGGSVLDQQSTETSAADQVRLARGQGRLGKSRRMVVDVPAGTRRVTLELEGAPSVLVRLLQAAPAAGAEPLVSLTPLEAPRTVSVIEGEKTIPYYSVLPGKPVRLRVVGPTTLDLTARLDFDATMRGTQGYRLALSEQGRRLRTLDFKTTKATTASYAELKDKVPSKLDRVQVPIPEGTHEITVELLQPARGAAEVHARIPQPSVGNEE